MSAYTTLRIQRRTAMRMLIDAIGHGLEDELLEIFMDRILRDRLYDCTIVPDGSENDEDRL